MSEPDLVVSPRILDELIALRAENAALRKDAERYRWLRDNDFTDIYCDHITSVLNGDTEANPLFEMRLDAALADKPLSGPTP